MGAGDAEVECVFVLIGKGYFLIHRNTAELAEEHLRERQSVFYLGNLHLGFVHLYVYLQSVGSGGYSLFYHLVNIFVKFLYQVAVADGEFLFLLE